MKNSLRFIFSCLALVLMVSCSNRKPTKQDFQEPIILTQTKEVKEIVRDTIFKVEADSSYYSAYIDCVEGKPVIYPPSITEKKGRYINTPKVSLKDNQIKIDTKAEAQELFKQWRETYIKEHEQNPIYVPQVEYRDKPFTPWQKIQIGFGRAFMIFLALFFLVWILSWRKAI